MDDLLYRPAFLDLDVLNHGRRVHPHLDEGVGLQPVPVYVSVFVFIYGIARLSHEHAVMRRRAIDYDVAPFQCVVLDDWFLDVSDLPAPV